MMDKCALAINNYIQSISNKFCRKKILDVGCGTGEYTNYFCKNNNNVTGLDIKDFRQSKYKEFNFAQYDGAVFPFKDNFFDMVVSFDVIEHVEKDEFFVSEMNRCLKPGGLCICGTPNKNRLSNFLRKIIRKKVQYPLVISTEGELGKLVHIREYTESELEKLFLQTGFKKIKVHNYWFGLRGKINIGIRKPIIKKFAQYLFLYAYKN